MEISSLCKNHQNLFFSIINNVSNSIVITNEDKKIIYVNRAFEKQSGYKSKDVMGKNPRIFKSDLTPLETYQELNSKLSSGKVWSGRFINIHFDGNKYIEEATITPLKDQHGVIKYYVAEKKNITGLQLAEDKIQNLSRYDYLTQIPNRSFFLEEAQMMTRTENTIDDKFSIIYADLADFKEVNDCLGHLIGDEVLKEVARRIKSALSPDDFVARLGGDEFVVLHKKATPASLSCLTNKLSKAFEQPIALMGHDIFQRVNFGVSIWPRDGLELNEVLSNADIAMYEAKSRRMSCVFYTDEIGSRFKRESKIASKLKSTESKSHLYFSYQPKIYLNTGRIEGFEVLLRWKDPELGSISPAEFIPIAEKYRLIVDIGNWIIKKLFQDISDWLSHGINIPGKIAINISVQQIEHSDFYDFITRSAEKNKLSPELFELEVTESVLMNDPNQVIEVIDKLNHAGFSVSIDDFGTGFSSLAYIHKLKAKSLKIDKSFIDNIDSEFQDQLLVKSVLDLARSLGLNVIAEGVENKKQEKKLINLGCNIAQGYLYSRPILEKELLRLLTSECNFNTASLY